MERKGLIEKRGGEKDWTKMKIYIAMYRRAVHRVPGTCRVIRGGDPRKGYGQRSPGKG